MTQHNIIIIGAGLSGLVAAKTLKEAGIHALLLDKGRSVGGRLATRRLAGGQADHGAQFFTARTAEFKQQVDAWLAEGLVRVWGYGWSDGSLKRTANDGHPRYIVTAGMNALAHHLAEGLQVVIDTQVCKVEWTGDNWLIGDDAEGTFTADYVVMTPPVPQTVRIMDVNHVPLSENDRQELGRILYDPCLCGLLGVNGGVELPEPGAVQNFQEQIYWIADNQAKGISQECVVTVHANAPFSRENYDKPDDETLEKMRQVVKPYLKAGATFGEAQLKKWRYSVPVTTYPKDYYRSETLPIFFAGDAFGGRGRVEGAFMSGLHVAEALIKAIKG